MMERRAVIPSILLVAILILMIFAAPGCADDAPKDASENVPKATVEVEWEQALVAPSDLHVMRIQQTSDGGYFIVGGTNCGYVASAAPQPIISSCEIVLIKTDANGNVEWEKNKPDEWYHFKSVLQTSDGGYMFSFGDRLIKTDAAGDEEWQKALPRVSHTGSIVRQTSDGGYIVLGTEVFWGSYGGADAWLAKLDSSGNVEWEKTLGNGFGETVLQTWDNGFIILCSRGWLLKTDWTGQQERDGVFGHGAVSGIIQTSDGGFILTSVDDNGTWLTKLGSAGHFFTVEWDSNYAHNRWPYSIRHTLDGGFIVLEHGGSSTSLMKVDSKGISEWEAQLGDLGVVAPTSDGGYVAVRYTDDSTIGESDIWLTKLKVTPP